MTSLGFENYAEALKIYLSKYREVPNQEFEKKNRVKRSAIESRNSTLSAPSLNPVLDSHEPMDSCPKSSTVPSFRLFFDVNKANFP